MVDFHGVMIFFSDACVVNPDLFLFIFVAKIRLFSGKSTFDKHYHAQYHETGGVR